MIRLGRKTAIVVALGALTALAAPFGAPPAHAIHENYGGNAIVCYVKTKGDWFRCFHAGPMSASWQLR